MQQCASVTLVRDDFHSHFLTTVAKCSRRFTDVDIVVTDSDETATGEKRSPTFPVSSMILASTSPTLSAALLEIVDGCCGGCGERAQILVTGFSASTVAAMVAVVHRGTFVVPRFDCVPLLELLEAIGIDLEPIQLELKPTTFNGGGGANLHTGEKPNAHDEKQKPGEQVEEKQSPRNSDSNGVGVIISRDRRQKQTAIVNPMQDSDANTTNCDTSMKSFPEQVKSLPFVMNSPNLAHSTPADNVPCVHTAERPDSGFQSDTGTHDSVDGLHTANSPAIHNVVEKQTQQSQLLRTLLLSAKATAENLPQNINSHTHTDEVRGRSAVLGPPLGGSSRGTSTATVVVQASNETRLSADSHFSPSTTASRTIPLTTSSIVSEKRRYSLPSLVSLSPPQIEHYSPSKRIRTNSGGDSCSSVGELRSHRDPFSNATNFGSSHQQQSSKYSTSSSSAMALDTVKITTNRSSASSEYFKSHPSSAKTTTNSASASSDITFDRINCSEASSSSATITTNGLPVCEERSDLSPADILRHALSDDFLPDLSGVLGDHERTLPHGSSSASGGGEGIIQLWFRKCGRD